MDQVLVYSDSLTWGIIPNTRTRLPFEERWPGVLDGKLNAAQRRVRIIEDCLNGRRRTIKERREIAEASLKAGTTVREVAEAYEVHPTQIRK